MLNNLKNINWKLYISLMVFAFLPTIYSTLRIFYLGNIPNEWSFSIAGQLSWINLLYEILTEAILLPLFYFIGKSINDREHLLNILKTGLIVFSSIFIVLSLLIFLFLKPLLILMATNFNIINDTIKYIRLEIIANIFSILLQFTLTILFSLKKEKNVYFIVILRVILSIILDALFISNFNFSLNLGVNGIGYSNIIINILLFNLSLVLLKNEKINIFTKIKLNFSWINNLTKIGCFSGLESFIRNFAYLLMISRMINTVNEQGTYWVANSFIWGWLLIPITQLGELIKIEVSQSNKITKPKLKNYMCVTFLVCLFWIISIPSWKWFMEKILNFDQVDKLFNLSLILIIFYFFYAIQNIYDSIFYGLGKTNYLLIESILTNGIYYTVAFLLYLKGIFIPSLNGIALLFGIGLIFDSIVTYLIFILFQKNLYDKK